MASQSASARSHLVRTTTPRRTPKREDIQVLYRLRHEALVRRDDKHRKVDAARAGEHGFDEFLVTRHVHHAGTAAVWKVEPREAEARW